MFRFWWTKDKRKTFTKVRVEFCIDAEQAEHIVAKTYSEITNKKKLKEAIQAYLKDYGWEFKPEDISYEQEEVETAYAKARPVVQRFMPELYAKHKEGGCAA